MRRALISLTLGFITIGCDSPSSSSRAKGTAPSASASSALSPCAALGEQFREVWTNSAPAGMERRRGYVNTRMIASWTSTCASIKNDPAEDIAKALDELRSIRTFAAIEALPQSGGTKTKQTLVKALQDSMAHSKAAFAVAPSGVDECEEAIASASFCGDDVDKASVKSAAGSKDEGSCVALSSLLAKKCALQ